HRIVGSNYRRLQRDLEALGLRRRRQHDTRRSLITLARVDGASRDVLRACTHGDAGDVFDGYTSWPWETKCREVAKLRIGRRGVSQADPLGHNQGHSSGHSAAGD